MENLLLNILLVKKVISQVPRLYLERAEEEEVVEKEEPTEKRGKCEGMERKNEGPAVQSVETVCTEGVGSVAAHGEVHCCCCCEDGLEEESCCWKLFLSSQYYDLWTPPSLPLEESVS